MATLRIVYGPEMGLRNFGSIMGLLGHQVNSLKAEAKGFKGAARLEDLSIW